MNGLRWKIIGWIEALEKVKYLYNHLGETKEGCPLCKLTTNGCEDCVWTYFENMTCREYYVVCLYYSAVRGSELSPKWIQFRIAQIDDWIHKLKATISYLQGIVNSDWIAKLKVAAEVAEGSSQENSYDICTSCIRHIGNLNIDDPCILHSYISLAKCPEGSCKYDK